MPESRTYRRHVWQNREQPVASARRDQSLDGSLSYYLAGQNFRGNICNRGVPQVRLRPAENKTSYIRSRATSFCPPLRKYPVISHETAAKSEPTRSRGQ